MTARALSPRPFARIALAVAGLVALALLGCDSGLDSDNSNLPTPVIAEGEAAVACGSPAGGVTLALSPIGTSIIEGAPNQTPTELVRVAGSSSGLDTTTMTLMVFLLPLGTDCPSFEQAVATVAADGSFTGDLELRDDLSAMRAVAVAVPSGAAVTCGSTDACINAPGYLAISNTLEIRPGL